MILQVTCGTERRSISAAPEQPLSETLARNGWKLDLRCGGTRRCGRCLIELLAGEFLVGGERCDCCGGPRTVRSCDCFPVGDEGEIRIPERSLLREKVTVETGFLLPLESAGERMGRRGGHRHHDGCRAAAC